MIWALILVPAAAGLVSLLLRRDAPRRAILLIAAASHLTLTAMSFVREAPPALSGWLSLDAVGRLFLATVSVLFLAVAVYLIGYLRRERERSLDEGFLFTNAPEAVFTSCLLFFLSTMTLVCTSRHFGLLWVAVEATTLASAPLIYYHKHGPSLEATWKYLLICSVGIAIALLGNFCLAVSASGPEGVSGPLLIDGLLQQGRSLSGPWLKAAFVCLLVGYGTKMGLAPLHTWLPDAHSEAPSPVSALLSGALLNCAFLGIIRGLQVCGAAGEAAFAQELLVGFGLLSMAVAPVFIIGQGDYKRMLAYSSVEHMGILALGVGLGGAAAWGALFHSVNHSLAKATLFLVSGNILARYGTKSTSEVRGVVRALPLTGTLWLLGFFAIAGSPPFGTFLGELQILKGAIDQGRIAVAVAYIAALAVAFAGMLALVLGMAQGEPPERKPHAPWEREPFWTVLPPCVLIGLVLVLGLWVPLGLWDSIDAAARILGGP